jgi:cell wall-associated NlpC family hydrolase
MQWQRVGRRNVAPGQPVAAVALCAIVLGATDARAQLTAGPVRVEGIGSARKVLTVVREAERVASRVPARSAARVLPTAERYLGVPYRWGGTSPKTGFDCSGFVQYVFAKHGTRLPRTSRQQASSGQRVRPVWSALRPGDLVMFAEPGRRISHVAIYAGRRRIIHATGSGRRVRYDALDTKRGKWFAKHLVAARRVSPRGASLVSDLLPQRARKSMAVLRLDPPDGAPPPTGTRRIDRTDR